MSVLHVIIGKTFSGKSWVLDRVRLPKLTTYTTRPMRSGEVNGRDYHFIDWSRYENYKESNSLVACREYSVADGSTWAYFVGRGSLESVVGSGRDAVIILDLKGYLELKEYISNQGIDLTVKGYFLDSPLNERFDRVLNSDRSNEDLKEVLRRLYDDEFFAFTELEDEDFCSENQITVFKSSESLLGYFLINY